MSADFSNRLREAREAKGLSQVDLARRTGLTRQAVYSIESNRYQPNVALALRLAELLELRVEDIFGVDSSGPVVEGERLGGKSSSPGGGGSRAAVWTLRQRTLVLPLSELGPSLSYTTRADGLILPREAAGALRAGRVRVRLLGGGASVPDNVVVAGCDPAIHIVDERLRRERAPGRVLAWPMGSLAALQALKRGEVHVAGLHVVDPRSGESNVPFVRQHLGDAKVTLVTFAAWEAGLLVAASNPKRLTGLPDLARRGVRMVNREPGSGARLLLDEGLRSAGVPSARVAGYADVVGSHLEVGRRVSEGRADAGVGVEAIARLLGLGFVPIRTERYDLVIPNELLQGHPGVARLLDALVNRDVRAEVEALGGYDTSETGRRITPDERPAPAAKPPRAKPAGKRSARRRA